MDFALPKKQAIAKLKKRFPPPSPQKKRTSKVPPQQNANAEHELAKCTQELIKKDLLAFIS